MSKLDFLKSYRTLVDRLSAGHDGARAMELAVGGHFEAFGRIERDLLVQLGLRPEHYLVDVGCGSGRLANALTDYLTGPYLGFDVIPELVEHARGLVQRPDWRLEVSDGLSIPEADAKVDIVCFFSVLTHLLHEQSYVYLREARRVLKRNGRIVFSFLDFNIEGHWPIFESNVQDVGGDSPLNVFISRDAIHAWARHLTMRVELIGDGDQYPIKLSQPVTMEDGQVLESQTSFGQSICVLAPLD